ncbi:Nif3-like dinuclear metal center hexameric protein [Psychrobium sp. 1_MG-2023]|uniref:Nif3-like dinuclear metal center hexameric protein n=1 Tax=Psychrobium sp. 1_MG-2023 TaxID=3062624 RepID=UPI000C343E8B|nr:Nif3-like dinuclear metal center hexameric protein [Psychrobium sp. 1_MG-2023]MDP2562180.1 Nif3-like dinuclear metal center hexameric protein [Psychrobium sp. 1_MG-2023]PKF58116.1 Nif3-like dinuclear metal center hexameric protein [Alteromonadales bacterium alter-6D02]
MLERNQLLTYLDDLLKPQQIKDYCPNGLQVEGANDIKKIVTGVTASQALIDAAIAAGADTLLVHHGYFWKGENQTITSLKKRRIKALLNADINLIAYHLPLDIHPTLGNNAQLAKLFDITAVEGLELGNPQSVAVKGRLVKAKTVTELGSVIAQQLGREPLIEGAKDKVIKTIAWCSGGGQSFIEMAGEQGIDAFISGEVSEQTIHLAREYDIAFFAAGHHATERYGAKALGEHLAVELGVDVEFIDIDNPA